MRGTLVFLMFLFIQCVSSVVDSSGVTKVLNETSIVSTEKSQINISSLKKSNKIDEKEIFENGDDKENNLTERSFIWINTRYKKPLRTKIYNSKVEEFILGSLYPFRKSQHNIIISLPQWQNPFPPKPLRVRLPPIPPRASSPPRRSSPISPKGPPSSTSVPSPPSSLSLSSPQNPPNPPTPSSSPNLTTSLFRPHHNIKIPCTMPDKYSDGKALNKCNQGFSKPSLKYVYETFRQELPKMVPHLNKIVTEVAPILIKEPYGHNELPKIPHIFKSIMRSKAKETYGFPDLFQVHRSEYGSNELLNEPNNPDEINVDGNLITDGNFVLSAADGSDEDKLLERYIKHTLADNGVHISDDEIKKCKECSNGIRNKNCNCEIDPREMKSKLYQFLENKSKQLDLETMESKNKMNDYDNSSNDDTLNKTIVDALFTHNKINDLLH